MARMLGGSEFKKASRDPATASSASHNGMFLLLKDGGFVI